MSIADLGSLGEFIGSMAVVVTLVFLSIQMRQNTSALQSTISQSYLDRWMDSYRLVMNDDTLAMVIARQPETLEELSELEATKVSLFFHTAMVQTDFMYYQYRNGKLDPELWKQWRASGIETFRTIPIFKNLWGLPGASYSDEMHALVEQYIAESESLGPTPLPLRKP